MESREERYAKAIRFLTVVAVVAIGWAFCATISLINARHDRRIAQGEIVGISSATVSQ